MKKFFHDWSFAIQVGIALLLLIPTLYVVQLIVVALDIYRESPQEATRGDALQAIANLVGAFGGALLAGALAVLAGLFVFERERRQKIADETAKLERIRQIIADEIKQAIAAVENLVMSAVLAQSNDGTLPGSFFKQSLLREPPRATNGDWLQDHLEASVLRIVEGFADSVRVTLKMIDRIPHDSLTLEDQSKVWMQLDYMRSSGVIALKNLTPERDRITILQVDGDYLVQKVPPVVPIPHRPVVIGDVARWQERLRGISENGA